MSQREQAIQLLNALSDDKMGYVIAYLQGAAVGEDETPNAETLAAFAEVEEMQRTGTGQHFSGSTEEFFKMILEENEC